MIEIIIDKEEEKKTIGVIENGKLIEVYEENKENKHERNEGNIYVGIVKDIIPGMQAAFIDIGTEKNSFIHVRDIMPQIDEKIERKEEKKIKDLVKPKQKLLVQVQKDSNDKKGARTTTHIKLTGKYVILLPQTTIVTVSQKIQDETEKNRLIKLVKENLQENMGAIIRTVAEKKENEIIIEDLQKLQEQWKDIYQKFKKSDSKSQLLYTSPSIVEKIMLDLPSEKIDSIIVNTKEDYSELEQVVSHKIKLALEENKNLIKKYELENQIEKAKRASERVILFVSLFLNHFTMSASAVFILDSKGRLLISRDYRGDIPASVATKFATRVLQQEETELRPVVNEEGISYISVKHANLLCL